MRYGIIGLTAIGLALLAPAAKADLVLSGPTTGAGDYSTAQLAAMANAGNTVSDSTLGLTGISLWSLLGGSSGITTSTAAGDNSKNAILRYYLVGSGGGQTSVVSAGEINPSFGNKSVFVAYETTGGSLLAQPELIVPGATGRDVTSLGSLVLTSVAAQPSSGGGQSSSVTLSGNVASPGTYSLADLQALPPMTTSLPGTATTYEGTSLFNFIDPTGDITSEIVTTIGTDGYTVAFAAAELDPAYGGDPENILAYASNAGDFPDSGIARTILPGDTVKHGRWMSNLDSVIVTNVPEPASMAVLAGALGLLGAIRRKTRQPSPV
ncbi:PEP-CTERM sorting domain-containing protein [Rhodopila sp.]|uniref:PEP-CTERM sorting domain-containing protein n=1 Tax=Rhodopila sp. TaxID=2480087 RepID=UPI002C630285|nr:PEP-CTERM sorting domain-containing protein [Rhodopila sp.]HVZ08562.1 PEP-CTERM sorting domain-containing protein [Rhodopila sp.]